MQILPYYITERKLPIGCTFWTLWIFLASSGNEVWTTDEGDTKETVVQEYLIDNGLFGEEKQTSIKDMLLYKVDTTKTNLKDFHTWSDKLSNDTSVENVWRPFFWIGDSMYGERDTWGCKEEVDQLKLGKFKNIGEIWKVLRDVENIS